MNSLKIILILLIILFYILFFYVIIKLYFSSRIINKIKIDNSKIKKTKEIKEEIDKKKLPKINTYTYKDCIKKCSHEICNEYEIQKIKYNLCKKCKKKKYCYNEFKGICENCKNKYTCKELYGCNKRSPINPIHNFCIKCWQNN